MENQQCGIQEERQRGEKRVTEENEWKTKVKKQKSCSPQ